MNFLNIISGKDSIKDCVNQSIIEKFRETISLGESFEAIVESQYLILSNRKKCTEILQKQDRDRNDIIDFLISLHIVLEAGINGFIRKIVINRIKKGVRKKEIVSDLDQVNFIHKVILFFTMPNFDFQGKISDADNHYKAISKLRNFANIRNKLLHGHMVGEFYESGSSLIVKTSGMKKLNEEHLESQIKDFQSIVDAISFYFDCWQSSFTAEGKKEIKKQFLDISFLEKR